MNSGRPRIHFDDRTRSRRRRRRLWPWLLFLLVLAVGLYALAGFIAAPRLIEHQLAAWSAAAPGRTATSGMIRINPFTLTAEVTALSLADQGSGVAARADRIHVQLDLRSVPERRAVVRTLTLEQAQLTLATYRQLPAIAQRISAVDIDRLRIEQLTLVNGRLAIGPEPAASAGFADIDLSIRDFDPAAGTDAPFSFSSRTGTTGRITANGSLATDLTGASGTLELAGFDLAAMPFSPGGLAGTGSLQGRYDISAAFSAAELTAAPVLVLSDARLELTGVSLQPAPGLSLAAASLSAGAELTVGSVGGRVALGGRVQTATAAFVLEDTRVRPPQSFVLDNAATFITLDPASDGVSLSLGGDLRGAGPVSVSARLPPGNVSEQKLSMTLTGIPATMLSAYAQNALDRSLTAGRADIEFDVARSDNRIDGALHLSGQALELAPAAATASSSGAASVEMAAALLEDRDRQISLSLPFASSSGTVFDAATAALRARVAALTETPFIALEPAIEAGSPLASAIPFLPGDAALGDAALLTIDQLTTALNDRPRLGTRILGGYDPDADRDALARQQIELHVQLATAGPGDQSRPAPVDFDSPRVRDVLDEFAGERLTADRVAALTDRYNCDGAFSAICQRSYYRVVFDALVANEEIAPTTLNRLGRFRAQSIADALRQRGIADSRIEVGSGNVVETPFGVGLPFDLVVADSEP